MSALILLASSNDNITTGFSFSPSELYVNQKGECFEETYSSRETAAEYDCDPLDAAGEIERYFQYGYYAVSGEELKERFESLNWG